MKKDELVSIKEEIKKSKKKKKNNYKWVIIVTVVAFTLSILFSYIADIIMKNVTIIFSIIILFVFILLGVLFDVIGVAVTAADETVIIAARMAEISLFLFSFIFVLRFRSHYLLIPLRISRE